MSKTTFTAKRRAEIAWAWASSGMTQAAYAQKQGISDRTLRQWIKQFVLPSPSSDAVRHAIRKTIAELERVLAAFAAAECRAATTNEPMPANQASKSAEEERPIAPQRPFAPTTSDTSTNKQLESATSASPTKPAQVAPHQRSGAFVYDW